MEKEKQKTERKEHILVCLSFSPSNEKIIRTAAQMARAFGANFTALYVQTAEPAEKTPEDQARLQKHIRLAEQSGAEIVTTHSEDIALQIAEYARISEVTRIVIGKSMMDQGFFRKRRGWTERLTDLVPDLEIHIIPDSNIITIYLVGVMMTSTVLGLITMIFFRPRTWCVYCPMGTMTQGICKLKHRKEGSCCGGTGKENCGTSETAGE